MPTYVIGMYCSFTPELVTKYPAFFFLIFYTIVYAIRQGCFAVHKWLLSFPTDCKIAQPSHPIVD